MLDTLPLQNGQLSQPLIDQYWNDGYLFPLPAISRDHALNARIEFEKIERDWLNAGLPQALNSYKRVNAHVVMPFAVDIACHPQVLDVIEGIIGPDIMIYSVEFFSKEPHTDHVVSMHQDLTYWGMGAIDGLVTAWIPLSSATPASGCMDFVRGSHKNPILPHDDTFDDNNLLSRGQEVRVDVDPADKVAIEIHPGQMSLHHGLTIHGSGPNMSDDRRIACVVRYIRPDMSQEQAEEDFAMLARGEDRFGNFTQISAPKKNFAPEAVALYDHIRQIQAQVYMNNATQKSDMYA
ncbi:phytanoyl-CoA dioxygenase family protein [Roseovarius sp. EL26]|uniref:phytanoyl-CoA dioxygenase family protein n=1 Tax=Roseovarius sp. EL26 TaxID=2126672 RepID=UPI000EA1DA9C|nr:phytanoyl-CoA dioxygenase family protein [Roseovarius sp. EL26]